MMIKSKLLLMNSKNNPPRKAKLQNYPSKRPRIRTQNRKKKKKKRSLLARVPQKTILKTNKNLLLKLINKQMRRWS